jgi:RNA polymerase subunit RPABC4/transcription elongation factor Spt4
MEFDYKMPTKMSCKNCGMTIPIKCKICPYCKTHDTGSEKAQRDARGGLIIYTITVVVIIPMIFLTCMK